jgi:hypothetical protein
LHLDASVVEASEVLENQREVGEQRRAQRCVTF